METRMLISFIFALAKKAGVKPKDLAASIVNGDSDKYLAEFTVEFAKATAEAMIKKDKSNDTRRKNKSTK